MNRDQLVAQLEPFADARIEQERQLLFRSNPDLAGALKRFLAFVRELIEQIDDLAADGILKKEAVIIVANRFYQELIAPLDLPGVPNFIENRFVDPAIGRLWESMISAIVDQLVVLVRPGG